MLDFIRDGISVLIFFVMFMALFGMPIIATIVGIIQRLFGIDPTDHLEETIVPSRIYRSSKRVSKPQPVQSVDTSNDTSTYDNSSSEDLLKKLGLDGPSAREEITLWDVIRDIFNPDRDFNHLPDSAYEKYEPPILDKSYDLDYPSSRKQSKPIFDQYIDEDTSDVTINHHSSMYMSADDKQAYLSSAEWKSLRATIFARDHHQCQHCYSAQHLNCHHITYARLSHEKLSDLTTLCKHCHSNLHKLLGYDRSSTFPISTLQEKGQNI